MTYLRVFHMFSQVVCLAESFFDILKSTESDAERTRLKHVISSGYNLSRRQASSLYKISRMKERAIAVSEACQKAEQIKSRHRYLAKAEQRAFLTSQGVDSDAYKLEGSSSEDNSEDEEEDISESEKGGLAEEDPISSQSLEEKESSSRSQRPMAGSCIVANAHGTTEKNDATTGSGLGQRRKSPTASTRMCKNLM